MLRLALRFELRALLRGRAGMVALVAFLAVGALAIAAGQRHVSQWHEAVTTARRAQDESVAEARRLFEQGAAGPPDRPWVDLAQPGWQDRYSSTRVTREPGPLAGVAAGAVDPAPVAFQVSGSADPLSAGGHRIENPELDAGVVDLAFVLAVLLPLLIGVLGVEIGGRERQEGIERLVVVQAGESRRWLIARMLAVAAIAAAACAALCIVAGLVGGASGQEIATLVGSAWVYTAVWSGLMLAVNAHAGSIRDAAFALGTVWTLLCILLPTVAAEVSLSRVEADFAVTETLGARTSREAARQREPQLVVRELYARYPELERLPAAMEDPLDPKVGRHAADLLLVDEVAARHAARREQEQRAQVVSERAAWLSPVVALELGLERMAGVGPEAASEYREYLMQAVEERAYWVVTKAWTKAPVTQDDFDALQRAAPAAYLPQRRGGSTPIAALSFWAVVSWSFALLALSRAERRRAPRR
ncbi:MAG: DUF3526 domain-containing protein [Myxococcota bacterium]